jgi:hypothetical protein
MISTGPTFSVLLVSSWNSQSFCLIWIAMTVLVIGCLVSASNLQYSFFWHNMYRWQDPCPAPCGTHPWFSCGLCRLSFRTSWHGQGGHKASAYHILWDRLWVWRCNLYW